jgi:hypothetical protein
MFPPSCVPVFDVHPNRQHGQFGFQEWFHDKANAHAPTQHAAGSVHSPPFPSTSPPSLPVCSFDQLDWTALLTTDCSSNLYAGRLLGIPVSDLPFGCGSQDLEFSSSSSSSSYVMLTLLLSSSTLSPRNLARPHHQWHHPCAVMIHCILPPLTCSHTLHRVLLMLLAKTSPLQFNLTKITSLRGTSPQMYLALPLLCIIHPHPLSFQKNGLHLTFRVLQDNLCRALRRTISAPSLATSWPLLLS